MSRVGLLRAGYLVFGLAFLAIAATELGVGAALFLGLAASLVAGILLAFSQDDVPKWAGIVMVAYFAFSVLMFLASTPITINKGEGYFVNDSPSKTFAAVFDYALLAFPIMLAAAAFIAVWERERGPRILLGISIAGAILWAVLSFLLVPEAGGRTSAVAAAAASQNRLLDAVAVGAALLGAAGAAWAAWRPDEYA